MPTDKSTGRARLTKKSSRAPLAYYSSGRPNAGSPFQKKNHREGRRYFSKAVDFFIIAVILAAIAYSLLLSPTPKLVLNSEVYHPNFAYRQALVSELKSFKNRNKLTFDEKSLISNLQGKFPEIASASVDIPIFGETPRINLNIAAPSFFLNSQGINYIIDSEGVAIGRSNDLAQIKGLPVVIDQTGFNNQPGNRVLSVQSVSFINTVIAQLQHAKVKISTLTLPPLAQELDLRTADRSYYVKFYLGGDALVQVGQFLAARHQFDQTGSQPSQYLDVRVPGKIYYK